MLEGSSLHNYSESNNEIMDVDYEDTFVERKDWFEVSDNPEVNKYANIAIHNLVTKKGMSMEDAETEIKLGVPDEEEHRETIQKVIDGKITIDEAIVEIAYVHIMESKEGKFYRK